MSWSGRADSIACCGEQPGAIDGAEDVVRLLHSRISDPDKAAFTRTDLMKGTEVSNVCGLAHGCSVDRSTGMSDDEIRTRSEAQALKREGRNAEGGLIANVAALRGIAHELAPEGAVRIYDDPMPDNDEHAVIRIVEDVPRADFNEVRSKIMAKFDRRVA